MYQQQAQNGYSLLCIGRGNGLTKVANGDGEVVYQGNYNDCVKWLADRSVVAANGKPFPKA